MKVSPSLLRAMRPETKQIFVATDMYPKTQIVASSDLPTNCYQQAMSLPTLGTSDTQRIGDTINIKKLWIKVTIKPDAAQINAGMYYRIILFTSPAQYVDGTAAYGAFWKWGSSANNKVQWDLPNREVVNVLYDKTFRFEVPFVLPSTTNQYWAGRQHNFNITKIFKKPFQFVNGTSTPKQGGNVVYIAIVPYIVNKGHDYVALNAAVSSQLYYTG